MKTAEYDIKPVPKIEVDHGQAFLDAELLDPGFRGLVLPVRLGNLSRKAAS